MNKITGICIHHSGGTQADPYASSAHITPADINAQHKAQWNFHAKLDNPYPFVGYNFVYQPSVRGFTQHRYIGEETAAVRGHNLDTISICIIGNYSRVLLPAHKKSVDELTSTTIEDVTQFLLDLVDGNKREWAVAPHTQLSLSPFRIKPHRFFTSTTECFGTAIPDDFFMKQVLQKKHQWLGSLVPFLAWLNSFGVTPPLGRAGDNREHI
jgi:hypothetical protein